MSCPVCNTAEPQARIVSPRKRSPEKILYWDCSDCGLVYLDRLHHLDHESERQHYLGHQNNVHDPAYQNFVRPLVESIHKSLRPPAQGLDFGAGAAPVTSLLLTELGYEVALFDPVFQTDTAPLKKKWDFVFACEVIEHFNSPQIDILRLRDLTRAGGFVFAMTHIYDDSIDFASWYYRRDPTHVVFYREKTLLWMTEHWKMGELARPHPRVIQWKR